MFDKFIKSKKTIQITSPYTYRQSYPDVWDVIHKPTGDVVGNVEKEVSPTMKGLVGYRITNQPVVVEKKFLTVHSAASVAALIHKRINELEQPTDIVKHPFEGFDLRLANIRKKIINASSHPIMDNPHDQQKILDLAKAHMNLERTYHAHYGKITPIKKDI